MTYLSQIGEFPHTAEQEQFITTALTGKNIKGNACAGSGKTSTAIEVIGNLAAQGKHGLYVTFNKANATEMVDKLARLGYDKKFIAARTAHSLAWGSVGRYFKYRLRRVKATNYAEHVGDYEFTLADIHLSNLKMLSLALLNIKEFCQSDYNTIVFSEKVWDEVLKDFPQYAESAEAKQGFAEVILEASDEIWDLMSNFKSKTPVSHDVYLKLWQLSKPTFKYDYIIFDEAQDASAVMLSVVLNQNCQKIFIGDEHQQIYSWRGAVNAMQQLPANFVDVYLNQAFRYGQPIADLANKILNHYKGVDSKIRGFEKYQDAQIQLLTNYDAYICRTNMGVVERLLLGIEKREKITTLNSVDDLLTLFASVKSLQAGEWGKHPDLIGFGSWESVERYVTLDEGADLRALVNMVKTYGVDRLLVELQKVEELDPKDADVIVTTAHKCKGWEWGRVKLHNDFVFDDKQYNGGEGVGFLTTEQMEEMDYNTLQSETANLLYVACTRAQQALDITQVEPLQELI